MKLLPVFLTLLLALTACAEPPTEPPTVSRPNPISTIVTTRVPDVTWAVYHPDPEHPWNRLFRQFFRRTAEDGREYGSNELDPLLWFDTTYLLDGASHQQAIEVLNEFLAADAEYLIRDPLRRAMFQRDLWAVFDWVAFQSDPYPSQRQAFQVRLAQILKRVALTREEILSLPDNYQWAVESEIFPGDHQAEHPQEAFLPSDLLHPNSAWIPMGREGGPIAMAHTEGFPFFGRSVFLVFVRSPGGRAATLEWIHALNTKPRDVLTAGADVALVRRMLLIDDRGDVIPSPLIETVQLRHFNPEQSFHEFELNRKLLFDGTAGGFRLKKDLFLLFSSHGDVFAGSHGPNLQARIPDICKACHFETPPLPNSRNTQSILSYSRSIFPLPDSQRPVLVATSWDEEAQIVIEWKLEHETWLALEGLWNSMP